jgi:hypothetical protein
MCQKVFKAKLVRNPTEWRSESGPIVECRDLKVGDMFMLMSVSNPGDEYVFADATVIGRFPSWPAGVKLLFIASTAPEIRDSDVLAEWRCAMTTPDGYRWGVIRVDTDLWCSRHSQPEVEWPGKIFRNALRRQMSGISGDGRRLVDFEQLRTDDMFWLFDRDGVEITKGSHIVTRDPWPVPDDDGFFRGNWSLAAERAKDWEYQRPSRVHS